MDNEQRPGSDGEIDRGASWSDEKLKRGSSLWRSILRHPLFWAFVAQFICLAAVCMVLVVVSGALDLTRLRCMIPGQCSQGLAVTAFPTVAPSATMLPTATTVQSVSPTLVSGNIVSIEAHGTTTVVTVTVDAAKSWQSSLTTVDQGARLSIEVIAGQWTEQQGVTPYNAGDGNDYICSKIMAASACVEPMPGAHKGALLGQIGNQLFEIGNHLTLNNQAQGPLRLRINDPDSGLYDNDGILTIRITIS